MDKQAAVYGNSANELRLIESIVINPPREGGTPYFELETFLQINSREGIYEENTEKFLECVITFLVALFLIVDSDSRDGFIECDIDHRETDISILVYRPVYWKLHQYHEFKKILLKRAKYYKWKMFVHERNMSTEKEPLYILNFVRA